MRKYAGEVVSVTSGRAAIRALVTGDRCSVGGGDSHLLKVGDVVTVEVDSDDYPVTVWKGDREVWPARRESLTDRLLTSRLARYLL